MYLPGIFMVMIHLDAAFVSTALIACPTCCMLVSTEGSATVGTGFNSPTLVRYCPGPALPR